MQRQIFQSDIVLMCTRYPVGSVDDLCRSEHSGSQKLILGKNEIEKRMEKKSLKTSAMLLFAN